MTKKEKNNFKLITNNMPKIKLFNTLSGKKEEFVPIKKGEVGLYTCGPTVYNYAHIGNLRTYIFEDVLKRVLEYNGYKVRHVMNITDVGHLTGDADMGEDKLEKGAKREGKSVWRVAEQYTKAFRNDLRRLNIKDPGEMPRAVEFIKEQIDLINILRQKGFTYNTSDGIYFDTSKFKDYNKLSHLDLKKLREGARVEKNDEKRNHTDFALWKFSKKEDGRQMEWWLEGKYSGEPLEDYSYNLQDKKGFSRDKDPENATSIGFPGWHIECSAMSRAKLGGQLDIHCGGIDHINVHHSNEIAQSEAAYEKKFFNYWLHGAFLNIEGGKKMAKSDDNFLTLENAFIKKGIDPLVFRFAALQTHYRKPMEYSELAVKNARDGYEHLKNQFKEVSGENVVEANEVFKAKFTEAINDDLNMPRALAVVQEVFKSDLSREEKFSTILDFNKVLGLDLPFFKVKTFEDTNETVSIDSNAGEDEMKKLFQLSEERIALKKNRDWQGSDRLRDEIQAMGYVVEDTAEGMKVYRK